MIEKLDSWLDIEYVPSEEEFFQMGQEILRSKPGSATVECEQFEHSGRFIELISFDANERTKKLLSAFSDNYSAFILCLPIESYDIYVDNSKSLFLFV